jgi:hypothetical protein
MISRICSFILISLLSSCYSKYYVASCEDVQSTGYVHLSMTNKRKPTDKRYQEARKEAIRTLLYSGVAQSSACPTLRPLLQTKEERKKFDTVSEEIFSKEGHWTEFTNTAPRQNQSNKKGSYATYSIIVSTDLLRIYLEGKKIIKPVNSIF